MDALKPCCREAVRTSHEGCEIRMAELAKENNSLCREIARVTRVHRVDISAATWPFDVPEAALAPAEEFEALVGR